MLTDNSYFPDVSIQRQIAIFTGTILKTGEEIGELRSEASLLAKIRDSELRPRKIKDQTALGTDTAERSASIAVARGMRDRNSG